VGWGGGFKGSCEGAPNKESLAGGWANERRIKGGIIKLCAKKTCEKVVCVKRNEKQGKVGEKPGFG